LIKYSSEIDLFFLLKDEAGLLKETTKMKIISTYVSQAELAAGQMKRIAELMN